MTLMQLDLNDRSVRNEVLGSSVILTLPGSDGMARREQKNRSCLERDGV